MKKIFISIILTMLFLMPSIVEAKVKIENIEYETLDEAMLQIKEGETITLLDDVDVSDTTKYGQYYNWLFPDNATLDLNGHTIYTAFKNLTPHSVWLGNNLTIKNGTFNTKVGADYSLFIGDEIETSGITLENITTITGINIYNTLNVTLKNVTATGGERHYAVWLDNHTTVTIKSGNYSRKNNATLGVSKTDDFTNELIIEGGRFIGEKGNLSLSESDETKLDPIIKGGTYDFDVSEFVPEGYECKEKNNAFVVELKEYDRDITINENTNLNIKVEPTVNEILKEAVNNSSEVNITNKDVNVALNIKDIKPTDEIKNNMSNKIKDGHIANYFDIRIDVIDKSTNTIIGNLTTLNNKIALSIEIPKDLKLEEGYTRKYYILRNHNGIIDILEPKLSEDGKNLTFETDKFSIYALVYEDTKNEESKEEIENPATEDKLKYNVLLMSGFAIIAIGGILYLGKKESLF